MNRTIALATVLTLTAAAAPADARLTKTGAAEASFTAQATGNLKIRGVTSEVRVGEQQGTIVIVVPLATLKTGIGMRDRHMREKYLETDKFPNAELRVPRASVTFPDGRAPVSKTISGSLTVHGVTRPTAFSYAALRDGNTFRVNGAMRIRLQDFAIETPSFMGVSVKDLIDIKVSFAAIDTP